MKFSDRESIPRALELPGWKGARVMDHQHANSDEGRRDPSNDPWKGHGPDQQHENSDEGGRDPSTEPWTVHGP